MDLDLNDKVAIVTGGARGIGREIALTLAAEGAKIIIVDILESQVEATVEEIKRIGADSVGLDADVNNFEEAQKMGKDVKAKFGRIDILVNNAGKCTWYKFEESQRKDWEQDINTSVYGTLNCCRAVIGYMMEQGNGRIVSISSTAAILGAPRQAAYQGAKAAVAGITRALAVEYGRYGIAVNCVAPGLTMSDMTRSMKEKWDEGLSKVDPEVRKERENFVKGRFPLGQWGLPKDIANMVAILCSKRVAGRITGQMIVVDGGMSIVA